MSAASKRPKEGLGLLGVGAAACAACCAGPILGLLAAMGIGTAVGVALFGFAGLLVAVVGAALLLRRRSRQQASCTVDGPVPVELGVKK